MTTNRLVTAGWQKRALALFRQKQFREAGQLVAEVCRQNPRDEEAWLIQGLCAQHLGRLDQAMALLQRAVSLNPSSARFHNALGGACLQRGHVERALGCFRAALRIENDYAEAHDNLTKALLAGSYYLEAVKGCQTALEVLPDCGQIRARLAFALEQTHQLDAARSAAQEAIAIEPGNVRANLILAKLDKRSGYLNDARARLQRALGAPLPPSQSATLAAELGDVLDRMGDYDAAFRAFENANQTLARTVPPALAAQNSILAHMACNREWFTRIRTAGWKREPSTGSPRSPIFLVGFPRSGTTLTEQVICSLPQIVPTDERPVLSRLVGEFSTLFGRPVNYPEGLAKLTGGELGRLRNRYWALLQGMLGGFDTDRRVLDKLPLNIIELGLVYRLFPDARVIVVLRDPRDCCLSCFMQPFLPNQAMVNFLTLRNTVNFYAAVMDLWRHYRTELDLNYIEVRYEDLVEQFEPTARRLVDFVGEPWSDTVLKYFEHAQSRNVSTPSYAAVASPIYSRSVGRWRHYHAQMEPVLEVLQPYVAEFGYE